MDDREYLQPILETYGIFKPLKTTLVCSVNTLAALSLEILGVVYALRHREESDRCREYFILIYLHSALWFLTFIVDQIVRRRHHNLRLNGYLEFYNKTKLHQLPLYIVSLWNATILILAALMQHFYPDNFAEKCVSDGILSPVSYLCALITFEFCLLFGINIYYILKVRKFNIQQAPPDVQREEWNACSSSDSFAQGEVGFRQLGDKVYDFIEKQADLIRHLKDHNARLSEKLMILNAQNSARSPRQHN